MQRVDGDRCLRRLRRRRGSSAGFDASRCSGGRTAEPRSATASPTATCASTWTTTASSSPTSRRRAIGSGHLRQTSRPSSITSTRRRPTWTSLPRSALARSSPCTSAHRPRSTWPPNASLRCATPPPIATCRWRSSSPRSPRSPTVATAWEVVRLADRPNAGILLDLWHHRRGGNDDDALRSRRWQPGCSRSSSPTRSADPIGPPLEDVIHRRLPGDGELGVVEHLRTLDATRRARSDRHRGVRRSAPRSPGQRRRLDVWASRCAMSSPRPCGISIISY